jgi:MFS family permease
MDRELTLVASVVVLGAIMSILDVTVVNVAINTLARDFDTTLPTIQWVVTGDTLALATVIPLTGWAADRFGTMRLSMISLAPPGGGIGAAAAVPPAARARIAEPMAEAFGATFWWALALVVIAFLVATPLLPKERPAPVGEPAGDAQPERDEAPRAMAMH